MRADGPFVHNLLNSSNKSTDLEGLLTLLTWFRLLKAYVPELVGDGVEVAKADILAWLHFL